MKKCKVKNCKNSAEYEDYGHIDLCSKHYTQMNRHNKILRRTRFDKNQIIDCGNYCEIILYSGLGEQKEVARAKIDKEDLEKVKNYKWSLNCDGYSVSSGGKLLLHALILGKARGGLIIDHCYFDRLDNRKKNLRFVTNSQNLMNTKSKGYYWNKRDKKWIAEIKLKNNRIYLGCFINEQDAINARRKGEEKYFGEYANRLKYELIS